MIVCRLAVVVVLSAPSAQSLSVGYLRRVGARSRSMCVAENDAKVTVYREIKGAIPEPEPDYQNCVFSVSSRYVVRQVCCSRWSGLVRAHCAHGDS